MTDGPSDSARRAECMALGIAVQAMAQTVATLGEAVESAEADAETADVIRSSVGEIDAYMSRAEACGMDPSGHLTEMFSGLKWAATAAEATPRQVEKAAREFLEAAVQSADSVLDGGE